MTNTLPLMQSAFRTTITGGGQYAMTFKFASLADMHAADGQWRDFEHEQPADRIKALEAELAITDQLLNERNRLLAAIPECGAHGQCVPHAIEWVEQMIAKGSVTPVGDLLLGQQEGDIPWRNVQPDLFCSIMSDLTVFDGKQVLRCWNAMKTAIEARIMPAVLFDTRTVFAAMSVQGHSRTSSENVADVLDAVVKILNKQ